MKKLMLSLALFLTSTQVFAFGGTDSCPEDCNGRGDKCGSIGGLTTGASCSRYENGNTACNIPD